MTSLRPLATLLLTAITASAVTPPPTGSITLHRWTGVGGTAVSNLTSLPSFPDSPNVSTTDNNFHAPTDLQDNYGTRMFGWVHAPVTGSYTFWIHSDDNSELWLSSSASPEDKQLIASVPEWTADNQWTKFASQQAVPVNLVAGEFYYIEALQKEGGGGDNLGVGWSYPGRSRIHIPGSSLSPWQNIAPEAVNDAISLHVGAQANIPVLANDIEINGRDDIDLSTLAVTSGPSQGTVSVDQDSGTIHYTHTGPGTGSDAFDYEFRDQAGLLTSATVDLTISADLRLPNSTVQMPPEPPSSSIEVENAFSNLSFSQPLCLRSPPGDTKRLFVCEKTGDLELIPDVTAATPTKTLFLNIDAIVNARSGETLQTSSEQGLLSVAFHPDYATNGYFFTVYSLNINNLGYQRLSRWHDPNINDTIADPNSEEIIIEMRNEAGNHNGGDIHFGPDGYLYMSWGDEGGANDQYANSQFLDEDFWSSITRIDVDLEPEDYTVNDGTGSDDDNLRPNPHPAIVLYNGHPLYEVPDDNPWVGATSFNGVGVPAGDVRTEFYAVGFRNPWRFSFDSLTGELWLGDVGQGAREEIDTVTIGSNHGWAWFEGDNNGVRYNQTINGASRTNATLTFPEWDYPRSEGYSVTGGLVFRGSNIASLYGKYIFGDYGSGKIWALERTATHGSPDVVQIAGEAGIAGFGTDPSNGDLLMADVNGGQIHRLVSGALTDPSFPDTLSETGLFADLATLIPNPGVVPYEVKLPFWSDHALKQRWFVIGNTSDQVAFSADAPWTFPEGMVFVKHFDLELTRGNPATRKRIETRVLVRNATGLYGVSYKWNAGGTEAFLAPEAGEDLDLTIDTGSGSVTQTWHIPSHAECIICHTPQAGHALSFNTRQLNHPGTLGGASDNFLSLLFNSGYLDSLPSHPANLPQHIGPTESQYSLEARVRSYLDVNCAYCHRSPGTAPETWFGNHHLTLHETGIINGPIAAPLNAADRLIVPGQTTRSIILSRVAATNGYTRMPPIASNVPDQTNIQLLSDWITQEASSISSYNDWRIANFGNDTSPEGEPGANPDGDESTNEEEWLAHSDPNDGTDVLRPRIHQNNGMVEIDIPGLPSRRVTVQRSINLLDWLRWDIPANNGIPLNPATTHAFSSSMVAPEEFFRFVIEEN